MKHFLLYLFYPITALYGLGCAIRNFLYRLRILKTKSHSLVVISVGNLVMGGSGKTPHIEYLIRLLTPEYRVAVLSRGYGRKTRGFRMVAKHDSPKDVGDEPLMFANKHDVMVAVDENRNHGIDQLLKIDPLLDVVLLDDAFQYRAILPDISILLTDFAKPFYKDKVFPFGYLREYKRGYKRADIIVFSKMPKNFPPLIKGMMIDDVKETVYQEVYFSSIVYDGMQRKVGQEEKTVLKDFEHVLLVTGIANPSPLKDYLQEQEVDYTHMPFPDHHAFSKKDIQEVIKTFDLIPKARKCLLTTEKDFMRLKDFEEMHTLPLFFLPIHVVFREDVLREQKFDEKILYYVRENRTNSKFYKQQDLMSS